MPRRPRLDEPGALHHVTARGIERRALFVDDYDRRSFLASAERALEGTGGRCFAWALMTNHVHLLLETGDEPLTRILQRLLTRHAMRFNRRHDRAGHLFQNRYHSVLVESEGYVLNAVRYVHLNPVTAGLVPGLASLAAYPWTGHAALMGNRPARFLDVEHVLSQFGDRAGRSRQRLAAFMAAGLDDDPEVDLSRRAEFEASTFGLRGMRARSAFLGGAVRRLSSRDARRRALRREGWTVERIVRLVCERMTADPQAVVDGRRAPAVCRARAVAAYLACEHLGASQSAVARCVGVGQSAIVRCVERGRDASAASFGGSDPFGAADAVAVLADGRAGRK